MDDPLKQERHETGIDRDECVARALDLLLWAAVLRRSISLAEAIDLARAYVALPFAVVAPGSVLTN